MGRLKLTITILVALLSFVEGEIELCHDGGELYRLTKESCPFGVLFMEPQTTDCIVLAGEDESSVMADVCTKDSFTHEKKTFQFIPEISEETVDMNNSCNFVMASTCNTTEAKILEPNSFLRHPPPPDITFASEGNDSNKDPVKQQTIRLFEYMLGLARVDVDTSLRTVMLLQKTFEIIKKFCPSDYVRSEFFEDVETAFIFMLHESDSTKIRDITNEEFTTIMRHLIYCEDQKNPFKYHGKKCATYSQIRRINKTGTLFSEFETINANTFIKFDVAVEGAWGAVDFVHGLCYGTFRDHINSHHLYQQALERLFTKEILYRWKNRFVFGRQDIWNNFFSTNVKNALTNMDICVQASYLNTPFLHRLERPIDQGGPAAGGGGGGGEGEAAPPATRRKKRWAQPHALTNVAEVEGYCFQTKEEADEVIQGLC